MLRYKGLERSKILSDDLWRNRLHTGAKNLAHARYMEPTCQSIGQLHLIDCNDGASMLTRKGGSKNVGAKNGETKNTGATAAGREDGHLKNVGSITAGPTTSVSKDGGPKDSYVFMVIWDRLRARLEVRQTQLT